jgi:hypothetical protein
VALSKIGDDAGREVDRTPIKVKRSKGAAAPRGGQRHEGAAKPKPPPAKPAERKPQAAKPAAAANASAAPGRLPPARRGVSEAAQPALTPGQ